MASPRRLTLLLFAQRKSVSNVTDCRNVRRADIARCRVCVTLMPCSALQAFLVDLVDSSQVIDPTTCLYQTTIRRRCRIMWRHNCQHYGCCRFALCSTTLEMCIMRFEAAIGCARRGSHATRCCTSLCDPACSSTALMSCDESTLGYACLLRAGMFCLSLVFAFSSARVQDKRTLTR